MSYMNKLFRYKKPYNIQETNELFLKAMQENCAFQYDNCEDYRRILDLKGFKPTDLKEYDDLYKLPFIPTLYFKQHKMFSMPEHKLLVKATSSGTSGSRSHMGFNFGSLFRALRMAITIGKLYNIRSLRR